MPEIQLHIADVPISGILQTTDLVLVYVMSDFAITSSSKKNVLKYI